MKRFLLFYYACYYPEGGMNDFIKDYDSLDELFSSEANQIFEDDIQMISQIYDNEKKIIVLETYRENVNYLTKRKNKCLKADIVEDLKKMLNA